MDKDFQIAFIGLVGVLVGGIIAIVAQWKFTRDANRRDTRNRLISAKAQIMGNIMTLKDHTWLVYMYTFTNKYAIRQSKSPFANLKAVEESSLKVTDAIERWKNHLSALMIYIVEVESFSEEKLILEIYSRFLQVNPHEYDYILSLSEEDFKNFPFQTVYDGIRNTSDEIINQIGVPVIEEVERQIKNYS